MAPGAIHHASWIAKALYVLKIYLFRDQFHLTAYENRDIHDVCVFIVGLYVKVWFTAPDAISAPRNDLDFLQNLKAYEDINSAISKAAVTNFSEYLWYLSEEFPSYQQTESEPWHEQFLKSKEPKIQQNASKS
jgi:hypothetical protein